MMNKILKDRLIDIEKYRKEIENSYGNISEKQEKLIKMQQDIIRYMEGYINCLVGENIS